MRKIIFLDIDGVLNSRDSMIKNNENRLLYGRFSKNNKECSLRALLAYIDFEMLELLKNLIERTESEIVIISAWVGLSYYPLIEEWLNNRGLKISGAIENYNDISSFIKSYLENNKVDKYIILKDDSFEGMEEFEKNLVRTNFKEGFTEEVFLEALNILEDASYKKYLEFYNTNSRY